VKGANAALVYGNFSDPKGSKVYQEIADHDGLTKVMEDYLEDYNAITNKPMSLVLFQVSSNIQLLLYCIIWVYCALVDVMINVMSVCAPIHSCKAQLLLLTEHKHFRNCLGCYCALVQR
jgi:hypothetical protein